MLHSTDIIPFFKVYIQQFVENIYQILVHIGTTAFAVDLSAAHQ